MCSVNWRKPMGVMAMAPFGYGGRTAHGLNARRSWLQGRSVASPQ